MGWIVWSWDEIEAGWLILDTPSPLDPMFPDRIVLGHPRSEVVEAFERVETHFGNQWIEDRRQEQRLGGILEILRTSTFLHLLQGVEKGQRLVEKLRFRDMAGQ